MSDVRRSALDLLSGDFEPEELDALLERLESDPEASAELDLVCDVRAVVMEFELARPAAPVRRSMRFAVAVTALAAATFLLWLGNRAGDPTELTPSEDPSAPAVAQLVTDAELAPPRYHPLSLRDTRTETDVAARFRIAMQPYQDERWEEATGSLSKLLEDAPDHAPAYFYRGAARQALGQDDEALADYAEVSTLATGGLAQHAAWRSAQLTLVRGETEKARLALEVIESAGGAYAPNATQLLAAMRQSTGAR